MRALWIAGVHCERFEAILECIVEIEPEERIVEIEPEERIVEIEPEERIVEIEPEERIVATHRASC
jgi:hypothetical protein